MASSLFQMRIFRIQRRAKIFRRPTAVVQLCESTGSVVRWKPKQCVLF